MPGSRVQLPLKDSKSADQSRTRQASTIEPGVRDQLEEALDLIRPAVRDDGGDVDLVAFEDGTVTIQFRGACVGCPSRELTLRHGIEAHLVQHVPGVEKVVALDD